jgi:hypothetical protein
MVRGSLLAALLVLGLSACQAPGGGSTAQKSPAAAPSYVDVNGMLQMTLSEPPHRIDPGSGDYRHAGSGLVLPETADGFRRVDLVGYNDDDSDISANYERGSQRMGMTVYIFPAWTGAGRPVHVSEIPEICETQFEHMKKSAEYRLQDPVLVQEQPEPHPLFPDAALSRMAIYDAAGDRLTRDSPPVRSEIHASCGVGKIWIVQYRISYRQDANVDANRRDFVAAVPIAP